MSQNDITSQVKSFLHSLIFLVLLFVKTSSKSSPLFIFGDSILDVGNNNNISTSNFTRANFWPYGIDFFHFPTGRFSDGRVISDFITEHANLPLIPPYLQMGKQPFHYGVNFASGGAGALAQTFQGLVIDLHMQLRNYKEVKMLFREKLGEVGANKRLSGAVHLFSIGVNDYLSPFITNSTILATYTVPQYVDLVIANITSVANEMYKTGGRKFAFLNVPQFACTPLFRNLNVKGNGDCLKEASIFATLHNQALIHALEGLQNKLPGFQYSLYDFYSHLLQISEEPSKNGFKEGNTACCGTGKFRGTFSCGRAVEFELCKDIDNYLYWDSVHTTEKANKQFADEMWSCANRTLCHGKYSIQDLFHIH